MIMALSIAELPAAEIVNLRNGFSIRHDHHESMGEKTRLYLSSNPSAGYIDVATLEVESFEHAAPEPVSDGSYDSPSKDLKEIISIASARSQIDADFIASVVRAESGNNPQAVSKKGAQGLMQLMPETAKSLGVTDSFDPADNIEGGVRYLRELLLSYDGDAVRALAAYNAGPQTVRKFGGVPPYRETRAYITRVIRDYNRKKAPRISTKARSKLQQSPAGQP
jgi:soluble lytic murein transglycosylase-like protein